MKNNKGFTLTEVLLAAMIVGLIGVTLAALTTAALRESGVGRVRLMLRNQASLFLRQLRQDVRASTKAKIGADGSLVLNHNTKLGPSHDVTSSEITYSCKAGECCRRDGKCVLNYVRGTPPDSLFFTLEDSSGLHVQLHVQLIVGMTDTDPVIKELIDETIILPQGFATGAD